MTADLSLIVILFNESRWTLKPQRSDFRQGKVNVWLSLAEQLTYAKAKLNLLVISEKCVDVPLFQETHIPQPR